jgi:hypothetical protein
LLRLGQRQIARSSNLTDHRSCTTRSLIGLISIPAILNGILRHPDRNDQQENRNLQWQSPTEK